MRDPRPSTLGTRLKQWLHFFTGDRDREAQALAHRAAAERSTPEPELSSLAREAVELAHGDVGASTIATQERPSDRRAQSHSELGADLADAHDLDEVDKGT